MDLEKYILLRKKLGQMPLKANLFGCYNVKELGEALADIMTFINKEEYEFKIVPLESIRHFTPDDRCGEDETIEIAILGRKGKLRDSYYKGAANELYEYYCDDYQTPFVLASSRKMTQCDANKGGFKSKLKETEQILWLNIYEKRPRYEYMGTYINDKELPDYLIDFMIDITYYRAKNDLINLDKEKLNKLKEIFIKEKASKYIKLMEKECAKLSKKM